MIRARDRVRALLGEIFLLALWIIENVFAVMCLRRMVWRVLAALVHRTRLFDHRHYLHENPDVARAQVDPLRHYVAYGDREGRSPMPLFDPGHYRRVAGTGARRVNSLLHYAFVGRYRRHAPSAWFDVRWYLQQYRDVARSGMDPLFHYWRYGGLEGRSPNPNFDGRYYLDQFPELRARRLNPLLHYLREGRFLGAGTRPVHRAYTARRTKPDWESLPQPCEAEPVVDVVVTVQRDWRCVSRCIYSVLTAPVRTPYRLVVVDDASAEPELRAGLDELSRRGFIDLVRHERARGFIASANAGLELHTARDVVLLDADCEVYGDWLDRLRRTAYLGDDVASVTPLSNNGGYASYPRVRGDNPFPLELPWPEIDRLASEVNDGFAVSVPSARRFCVYLRRAALDDVGLLDPAFGRGCGEIEDWSFRAVERGWRHLATGAVFVHHIGGVAFRGERHRLTRNARRRLRTRHRERLADMDRLARTDPLAPARRRLDRARLMSQRRPENVLLVCHERGGGAERHLQEDAERLRAEGKGVYFLRPERGRPSHVRIKHPNCRHLLNLAPFDLREPGRLAQLLRELRIVAIHSHGLVDFIPDAAERLLRIARQVGARFEVDIHDYKVICPRINLVDQTGRYCGEPGGEHCESCLRFAGNDFGVTDIRAWRTMHHDVLRAADSVWVPDPDVGERLRRYYPDVEFRVVPHEDIDHRKIRIREPEIAPDEPLHIVVIGNITRIKGFDVLLACARDARRRNLPLRLTVLGHTMKDRLLEREGVAIAGRYEDAEADRRLAELRPHVVWLPSVWPETYSYTLSIALRGGYPVFAFDLGAIARRLREVGQGENLWPLAIAGDAETMNGRFLRYRAARVSVCVAGCA